MTGAFQGVIGIAVERDREADLRALLRASADSMLDPQVLLEAEEVTLRPLWR